MAVREEERFDAALYFVETIQTRNNGCGVDTAFGLTAPNFLPFLDVITCVYGGVLSYIHNYIIL